MLTTCKVEKNNSVKPLGNVTETLVYLRFRFGSGLVSVSLSMSDPVADPGVVLVLVPVLVSF